MLISHKKKFITIDVPKTGTRSLRETLNPLGVIDIIGKPIQETDFYQHGTAEEAKKIFIELNRDWSEYFKFTILRNPWDRYFSFFKYFHNYKDKYLKKCPSIIWNEPELNQGKYCVELFDNYTNSEIMKSIIINHQPQSDFIFDENGNLMVDHLANFENLDEEFKFLCLKTKTKYTPLKHGNKSKTFFDKKYFYNEELIEMVQKKEKSVIEIKGYNF
jgi:hypothetical protein